MAGRARHYSAHDVIKRSSFLANQMVEYSSLLSILRDPNVKAQGIG